MAVEGAMGSRTNSGSKHRCQGCAARKARFQYRGRVRADRHHTLCFECYRSARDRQRAQRLALLPVRAYPFAQPADSASALTPGQVAHRVRMLRHLEEKSRSRQDKVADDGYDQLAR